MIDCEETREERDLYLRFMTLSLQNGKLVPPFTKPPPVTLRPLSAVVPRSVYNLVYKGKYATGDCKPVDKSGEGTKVYCPPDEIEPSLFLGRQPVPNGGGIVYAAAYSTK